ncbi:hypothetical protein GCM10027174_45140 [Salinifilum aidingensis]
MGILGRSSAHPGVWPAQVLSVSAQQPTGLPLSPAVMSPVAVDVEEGLPPQLISSSLLGPVQQQFSNLLG